jgi:molybdate transport system substrate-binding protein
MCRPSTGFTLIGIAGVLCLMATSCDRQDGQTAGPPAGDAKAITVFAASSATDVITALAGKFEAGRAVKFRLNFASSSTLARQIEAGAAVDVFFSADEEWMDYLQQRGLIRPDTRKDLVGNRLVLITPADKPIDLPGGFSLEWARGFTGRLAVGDPAHVPAGKYAKEALQSLGLYEALKARLIPCESVRSATVIVERGEATAGIVYATDARISPKVRLIAAFPEGSHKPIRYPVALCKDAAPQASEFVEYLGGPEAAAVFEGQGFIPLTQLRSVGAGSQRGP